MNPSLRIDTSFQDVPCYRMAKELLNKADIKINRSRQFDIQVKNLDFFKRVMQEGSLGIGESYIDGWWECERLDMFAHRVFQEELKNELPYNYKNILFIVIRYLINLQPRKRALIVAEEHYNAFGDVITEILDPYKMYSCGYWLHATTLEQAQVDKLELICQKLDLKPGMTLLDVGFGWGGLAQYAAQNYGVKVVGITISMEQFTIALSRCEGLDVTILLQDYRDLDSKFDRIAAIAVFEHIGPKNYRTIFEVMRHKLKPEGLLLLQTIGANKSGLSFEPWIIKCIFPNGDLPSIKHIADASEPFFVMEDWHNFGADYDLTLMAWYDRLVASWPKFKNKYLEREFRMFEFYLLCCAGKFRARKAQLWQILFSPQGVEGGLRVAR